MAQKSNPISLRLEKTNKHFNSCWYGDYNYTTQLLENHTLERYIENLCQQSKLAPPVLSLFRGRQEMCALLFIYHDRRNFPREKRRHTGRCFTMADEKRDKDWFFSLFYYYREKRLMLHHGSRAGAQKVPGGAGDLGSKSSLQNFFKKIFQQLLISLFFTGKGIAENISNNSNGFTCIGDASTVLVKDAQLRWAFFATLGTWGKIKKRKEFLHSPQEKYPFPSVSRQEFSPEISLVKNFGKTFPPFSREWPHDPTLGSLEKRVFRVSLKDHLEESLFAQIKNNCTVQLIRCHSSRQNPLFLAGQVVTFLQGRTPFRRIKDRIIRDCSLDKSIKGVRIACSGRVAARSKKAQKARTESVQWGQTSLHVFSDLVNFASKSALTNFGKIGVKVWICYQDR